MNYFSRLLVLLCMVLYICPAYAGQRLALVVGINNYENVEPLEKAANDAVAITTALKSIGFDVTTLVDVDRREFNRSVSTFSESIQLGDEVVFYFAGHGIEVDGRNFFLPSDVPAARPGDESFVKSESIAADAVLADLQSGGARVTLMIIDACRDNPFPSDGTRSLGSAEGLARMDPPRGAFVLFSAGTGQLALDRLSQSDPHPNSVFTRMLLTRLKRPGLSIQNLVLEVRNDVSELARSVRHEQFPAYYDQLSGPFYFVAGAQTSTVAATQQSAALVPADPCTAARADWQVLSSTQSKSALEAFVQEHNSCPILVAAARDRLGELSIETAQPSFPRAELAGNDICSKLWYERNLIFHNNGYCFSSARAKTVFGEQCHTRTPKLTSFENREVKRIQSAEKANGC